MVDSVYYSSRKITERCENSFVDYSIKYQKLCSLTGQVTKDLNSSIIQYLVIKHSNDYGVDPLQYFSVLNVKNICS